MSDAVALPGTEDVNVLLVDDRPDKLLALESILADLGPKVLKARSGQEALRQILRKDFAVILLDVNMPQMDGFETASLIRERQRSANTPIIFLTAVNDAEAYSSRGYSLGAVDYIHMPVPPEVLKAKVAVFVDLYLKSEQVRQQAEWMRTVQEREHAKRLAEAADRLDLETRRNRFFTLAVDMLGIAGFDGYFRQLNPSWERHLGFPESELRRTPISQLLHPDDREALEAEFRRLAEGAPTVRFENRHLHRDGSYRWLSWTAAPFAEEGLIYVFARDVTENKAAEEARLHLVAEQEARRAAQRENEIKDQFLATLSHELRAPLTPILGWTSMLRSGRLGAAEAARGIEVIHRNVKLQSQLMEDLLDVSRIVSGKLRLELRPMDLVPVIEAGLDAVRPAAAAKRLRLSLSLGDTAVQVQGDPERLQQVVWNLVANAVKFTPEAGRIDVSLELETGKVKLVVSDSGVGIDPGFLPIMFDRFSQGDTGTSRAHGGLGLGLTIVRHLVEAHGGTVHGESEGAGLGARLVVTLPSLGGGAPGPTPPGGAGWESEGADRGSLQGMKVLVVDDDSDVCELLSLSLRQQGARVTSASSVAEALTLLEHERPDVIVSDIGMPITDGYAFIERVRTWPPEKGGGIPAIALTAYATREDAARARAAGFQIHMAKPVDPERVVNSISSLVQRRA